MKIAIDGFSLSLKQGTGISTYTRELSNLLLSNGIELASVFGVNYEKSQSDLSWGQFIRQISIGGEKNRHDILSFAPQAAFMATKNLLGIPVHPNEIKINQLVNVSALGDKKLPNFNSIYNARSLFRGAQAFASLTRMPITIKLPKKSGVDIYHSTYTLPVRMEGVPNVVTVHDVIPLIFPYFTEVNIKQYRNVFLASLKHADIIFTVSEHSKNDLRDLFGVPEEKIIVTYQSVSIPDNLKNMDNDVVQRVLKKNYGLTAGQYFLFYGAIEPKKNVVRILQAMSMSKTDMPIVIVGKNGWLYDDVKIYLEQAKRIKRIIRIEYVSFWMLMYLLKGARGLVFPSLYEGFGLPVLEAMQMGCPVITSNNSSLSEVGGDAVHYVNPLSIHEIAEAIDQFSEDDSYINTLIQKGLAQAKKFTPEKHFSKILEGYRKLL